ncbi:hypothetical protein F5X96DRAFT_615857 [Biscogniauxia mediterranea]|nr:hypothetical protein F5X96DRAFT_615857 [Biscogniauxia mediterranea]
MAHSACCLTSRRGTKGESIEETREVACRGEGSQHMMRKHLVLFFSSSFASLSLSHLVFSTRLDSLTRVGWFWWNPLRVRCVWVVYLVHVLVHLCLESSAFLLARMTMIDDLVRSLIKGERMREKERDER